MQANIENFKQTKSIYKGDFKMLLTLDKEENYADVIYLPSNSIKSCFSEPKMNRSGKSMCDSLTNSKPSTVEESQNCLPHIDLDELISYVKAGKMKKTRKSMSPGQVCSSVNFDPLSIPITSPQSFIEDAELRTQPCKKRRKFTLLRKRNHDYFQFKKSRSDSVKFYFADDSRDNHHPVAKKMRLNSDQQSVPSDNLDNDDKPNEVVVEVLLENHKETSKDLLCVDDTMERCETEIHALSLNSGCAATKNEKAHVLSSSQDINPLKTSNTESNCPETNVDKNVECSEKEVKNDDQSQPANISVMSQNNIPDIQSSISTSKVSDTVTEVEKSHVVLHTFPLSAVNAEEHIVGSEEGSNLFSLSVKCLAVSDDNTSSINNNEHCQIAFCNFKTSSSNHSRCSSGESVQNEATNDQVKTKNSVVEINNENVDMQENDLIDEGNVRPTRKTRSSTAKIRKTMPKIQVRHTPLGLPKPVRMKKEKFSLEEIYLNKNFRTPTEKKWETIFEFPKENKDGSVSTTEKRKKRRMCDFSTDPSQRKSRSKKSRLKGRKYVSRCKAEETEKLLFQKLYRLDTALTLAQLSP